MEVRPGYKRTEVGVIPDEWVVRSLKNSTEEQRPISYGIVQTGPAVPNGIACLRVVDIDDGSINKTDLICTSKKISDSYRRTVLKTGDLVMPLRGKVGDVGEIDEELAGANLTRGVALLAIRPELSGPYCRHALSWPATRKRLEQFMNGSALQEIPIATLRSFQLALPATKDEQRAIATALSDVDALLGGLDRLIAKKRNLKQAAMQQLLTGQTRLPGFSGERAVKTGYKQTEVGVIPDEWDVKTIDQVAFVTSGKRLPLGTSLVEVPTTHPYIRVVDMRPGTIDMSEIMYVPESVFPAIKRYCIYQADIFISVAGSLGIVGKIPAELDGANLTENADRITDIRCSQDYLLYVLLSPPIQDAIDSIRTVGAQPKLALTRIRKFAIPLPPTAAEQNAIAAVLSDMETELDALEARREKTRDLKQAMMQELLTGKTRLVPVGGAHA